MDKGTKVGTRPGDAERPQESGAAAPGRGGEGHYAAADRIEIQGGRGTGEERYR